jgi:hypothetical protein
MHFGNTTKFDRKSAANHGFPAARHSPTATCAVFPKESRMDFGNATKFDRKPVANRGFPRRKAAFRCGKDVLQEGGPEQFGRGRLIGGNGGREGGAGQGLGCWYRGLLLGAAGEARSDAAGPQPVGHMLGYIY